jgi:hypothetical protein
MAELFDFENKFRVEVESKQHIIEEVDKELTEIKKKQEEELKKYQTDEYKQKIKESNEAYRRKWILEFYKELNPEHREMSDEEYNNYTYILDDINTKKGYSILSFIKKENPRPKPNPNDEINKCLEYENSKI